MKRLVFMGTPDFAVPALEKLIESNYEVVLVVTQPDRPVGRRRKLTPPAVKKAAKKAGIPVFQPEKIAEEYQEILSLNPDLIITAAYGQLLPKTLLEGPSYGCINVHASLLPKLRGGAPIHYALLQGEEETGITIMYMEEKLDAGDIISQKAIPIEEKDNVGSLHDKLSLLGADLLMETLPDIFENKITPIKQKDEEASFAPNITRDLEKLDFRRSAEEVFNHIRGLSPWPVAYTKYKGENIKIWSAKLDPRNSQGEPGEIIEIDRSSFTVLCGDGKAVQITEIQPAGNRRMSVEQYLHGSKDRITLGSILGE